MRRFRRARVIPGAAGQAREMSEQAALAKQTAQAQRAAALARVARAWEAFDHDQSKPAHVIVSAGIPVHHWETAAQGWRDRIQGNHAVARRFNQFYREAWA